MSAFSSGDGFGVVVIMQAGGSRAAVRNAICAMSQHSVVRHGRQFVNP